jgi:hypothetical protein
MRDLVLVRQDMEYFHRYVMPAFQELNKGSPKV